MSEQTYRHALHEALREEMIRDENVLLLGEDITGYGGSYAVTKDLHKEFGLDRVMETPIAETGIVAVSIGLSMGGFVPVAELMTVNFALLAMDQIVNHAAKFSYMFDGQWSVPIVIRTVSGFGQLAATHSQTFEGWFASVPGLKVVMPSLPGDAKGLLKSAIRDPDPVIFIEHSSLYGKKGEVPDDNEYLIPLGKASIARQGTDVSIISYSRMLLESLDAAEKLQTEGINCEVLDLRTLRPLDLPAIGETVSKTHKVVIATEDWNHGSFGSQISSEIAEHWFDELDAPIVRVAMADVPLPYAKNLETMLMPNAGTVVDAVHKVMGK